LWPTAIGWFATSDERGSGWASVLFEDEKALRKALRPRVEPTVALPADRPIMVCPFTGKPVVIRPAGDGYFEAVVDGLWVSRAESEIRRVEYMVSTRKGIPPLFDSSKFPVISIRERVPPPVSQPVPAPEGEGNVREHVERMVVEDRGSSPTVVIDGLRKGPRLRAGRPSK
jgi:hypothetical protein